MKICFYINSIGYGGAERVITNLAKQFALAGYEIVFITSLSLDNEYALPPETKRFILKTEKKWFIAKNFSYVKQIRNILKQEKPDYIISFMAEPNFRIILASRFLHIRTIVSVRNDPSKEYPNFLYRFLAKFLYRFAHGIVFQTQQAREWFPRCIQKRSAIIFNQVGEQFYQDYPVSKKEGIVTVGRLTKQKNHALLIEAFSLIHHKVEDNLYIYGDGALKSALEELITEKKLQKRVFLMGTNDHIETEIASKKLFVLPSDYEGMPNCLMEAMAMGVACISTNCSCGGPKELLGDIESIALCPINSAEKLADLMLVALVDNNRLIELSNYGKNKAEDFRTEVIFKKWRSYIENGQ